MNRRHFMTAFCLGAMTATTVFAASYEDSVIAQLRAQGYKGIVVERTLLGRVKIIGMLNGGRREIILNPRTGEVLRDLWIGADGGVSAPVIASAPSGGNTGGGGNAGGGDDNGGGGTGGGDDNGGDDNGGDDNGGGSGDGGDDSGGGEDDDKSGSGGGDDGEDGEDGNDD